MLVKGELICAVPYPRIQKSSVTEGTMENGHKLLVMADLSVLDQLSLLELGSVTSSIDAEERRMLRARITEQA
jgi:hypothetical protein